MYLFERFRIKRSQSDRRDEHEKLECRGYYYINDKEDDENENKQDVANEE